MLENAIKVLSLLPSSSDRQSRLNSFLVPRLLGRHSNAAMMIAIESDDDRAQLACSVCVD